MTTIALIFAGIACTLHVLFFVMESLLFGRPAVQKRFQVAAADAEAVKPWALNQGFYNLFVALGGFAGIAMVAFDCCGAGWPLVMFACAIMVGAATVLLLTDARMRRAAAIQGLPPLLAIALVLVA